MKIAILDASTLGADIDLTPITALGDTAVYPATAPEEVSERLRDADAVVLNKIKLNESNLSAAERLKIICVAATGYDNIDTAYCQTRGIAVCNVPGYSTASVVQVTLSMALSLMTHLEEYRDFVHSGAYSRSGVANHLEPVYHEIAGKTWGIVGGGSIGSGVARAAKAMGAKVVICRRQKEAHYRQADFDTLCRISDILSFHVPLSESTRGMLSRQRIAAMKKDAVIINVARGAVTDEQALADALAQGRIGGLGVDVYSVEPFGEDHPFFPLLGHRNLCLTPHMAWGSAQARKRCMDTVGENIRSFFAGQIRNRIV